MSGIFSFFKNFFGGLFGFLGGLFGSKQKQLEASPSGAATDSTPKPRKGKSGYYLELDDARSAPSAEPAKATKTEAPAPVAKPAAETAPTPAPVAAAVKAPEPAQAAPKPAANPLNLPQPTVTTFAPNYLAPTPDRNGRRRPGANMTYFLDLARQVKVPS